VVSVTPVYQTVHLAAPTQQCENVAPAQADPGARLAGSLIGAVIGGVTGYQFGAGAGKAALTGAGALIGSSLGQRVASQAQDTEDQPSQRCHTVYSDQTEQRPGGYDVAYQYQGQIYHTHLAYDPGTRLPVQVNTPPIAQ
jgi:uncharacterized protein YcfJ